MAKGGYFGVADVARKLTKGYFSPDGTARKIIKAYMGVGGVARPCWASGLEYYGTITSLSQGKRNGAATTLGDYALFGGSSTSNSNTIVEVYNNDLGKESNLTLNAKGGYLAATTVGDYALFGGGYWASGSAYYQNSVQAYDSNFTSKTVVGLYATARELAATTIGNNALFGGGYNGSFHRKVISYDEDLVHNSDIDTLTYNKYKLKAVVVGNRALFAGGEITNSYMSATAYSAPCTVDYYDEDLVHGTATSFEYLKTYLAATSTDDYALFGGGYSRKNSSTKGYYTPVFVYDKDLVYSTPFNLDIGRGELAATTVENYALFAGGDNTYSGGSDYYDIVDIFDGELLTKLESSTLSVGRSQLMATTVDNYALFVGGYDGDSTLSTVDVYTA